MRKEFVRALRANQYELSPEGLLLPRQNVLLGGMFEHSVWRDGCLIDTRYDPNIVVNEGLNHLLNVYFEATTQITAWYIGLFKGNYTPLATDTAANIAGNSTEATEYSEATRQVFNSAAAASQALSNAASLATFTINATVTAYGAFLVSSSTKSGTAGVLFAASRFAAARSLISSDLLKIQYTLTAQDA